MGYVNQHCKPRALIALDQVVMCLDGKPGVNQGQKCRILIGLFKVLCDFLVCELIVFNRKKEKLKRDILKINIANTTGKLKYFNLNLRSFVK